MFDGAQAVALPADSRKALSYRWPPVRAHAAADSLLAVFSQPAACVLRPGRLI